MKVQQVYGNHFTAKSMVDGNQEHRELIALFCIILVYPFISFFLFFFFKGKQAMLGYQSCEQYKERLF